MSSASFKSTALGVIKTYVIYFPEEYEKTDRRYPVIYQLHGWGVTEESWTAPQLNLQGKADELKLQAIVVMPDGDRGAYINSLASTNYAACLNNRKEILNKGETPADYCVKTPRYEDYIIDDLIPHIDKKYRTIQSREARAISGESVGGNAAMHLAMRHRALFSAVSSHSGALSLLYDGPTPFEAGKGRLLLEIKPTPGRKEFEDILGYDVARWHGHDPYSLLDSIDDGELAIYFDCGTEDEYGFHDNALHFLERLNELGNL